MPFRRGLHLTAASWGVLGFVMIQLGVLAAGWSLGIATRGDIMALAPVPAAAAALGLGTIATREAAALIRVSR